MRPFVWLFAAAALAGLVALPVVAQSPGKPLPEGKGKDLVETYCASCHGLDSVTAQGATKDEWETIVKYMVSRGLEATDDEIKTIVEYLAKAFPPPPAPPKPANKGK
jgi:mono/diheme cytochrome c family protein